MTTEVTRDVILDLLPMYLAGEVSADSRALVEAYLEADPAIARIARQSEDEMRQDAPSPLTKENEMQAYERARRWMFLRTVVLAAIISATLLGVLAFAGVIWMMFIR